MQIPLDWSKLSDDKVKELLRYLQYNIPKYEITRDEKNVIHMVDEVNGDKVNIARGFSKDGISTIRINNAYYKAEFGEITAYNYADDLYSHLEHRLFPFKTRAKQKWDCYKVIVYIVTVLGGASAIFVFGAKKLDEYVKQKQETFKQKIRKEALEEFKKEQQKNDSIIQYHQIQMVK